MLQASGIAPDGQRLPHLILAAELDALVVSGPRRGRDFTYMLMDERVPAAPPLRHEEALSRLAEIYFRSRGPAQLQDFAWWAGSALAEAPRGVAGAGVSLASEVIDGKRYWVGSPSSVSDPSAPSPRSQPSPPPVGASAAVAGAPSICSRTRRADRRVPRSLPPPATPDGRFDPSLFGFGSILSNVLVVGGRVRGGQHRVTEDPRTVRVQVHLLDPLRPTERAAVVHAADRMSRFLELPVELESDGPR